MWVLRDCCRTDIIGISINGSDFRLVLPVVEQHRDDRDVQQSGQTQRRYIVQESVSKVAAPEDTGIHHETSCLCTPTFPGRQNDPFSCATSKLMTDVAR